MNILSRYTPESKHPPKDRLKKYSQHRSLCFLLRHGQIQHAREKKFIGVTDVPMSHKGVAQAMYWKRAFQQIRIDAVYSSALDRCRHTARLIDKKKQVTIVPALNEINLGAWENQTFDHIKTQYPTAFEERGRSMDTYRPPGGESFLDVCARITPFFNHRIAGTKNILVVTHAGVIRVLLSRLLNMDLKKMFQIRLSYGELIVLQAA